MNTLLVCRVPESDLRHMPLSTSLTLRSVVWLDAGAKFIDRANDNYVCSVARIHLWVCIVMVVAATADKGNETEMVTPPVIEPSPQSKHTTRIYGVTLTVNANQRVVRNTDTVVKCEFDVMTSLYIYSCNNPHLVYCNNHCNCEVSPNCCNVSCKFLLL